jgi:hypothetical protein
MPEFHIAVQRGELSLSRARGPPALCTVAPRPGMFFLLQYDAGLTKEIHMYIGGGILGTILVIALIVFLVRRA